jgi:sugar lactone lactonase YvrE
MWKVLVEGLGFPEGPAFDPQGNLWCTDMGTGELVNW